MGHRQVRLQPDCLLVFAFGATRVSSLIQDRSEVVVNQGGIRVKTQRLAIGCRRTTEIAILRQHVAQQNPGTGIARNESKTQAERDQWFAYIDEKQGRKVPFVILEAAPATSDFAAGRALRRQLAERLPPYMLPRRFHFLDAFPMTSNGKADRKTLAEMAK